MDGSALLRGLDQVNNATRHGYTGHEHLDNVNLIHMNGRVFEPVLGRFLSADPFIDGISHSQGPNRFAYVHANPLAMIDPSGHCGALPGMNDEEASDYITRCSAEFEAGGYGILGQNERWCAAMDFHCQQQILMQKMLEHSYIQSVYRDMRSGASRPIPRGTVELPEGNLCMVSAEKSAEQCIAEFGGAGQNLATGQAAALAALTGAAASSRNSNPYGWGNLAGEDIYRARRLGTELLRQLNRFDTVVDVAEIVTMENSDSARWYRIVDFSIESGALAMFGPVAGTLAGAGWNAIGGSRTILEGMMQGHIHHQQFCERIGRINCYILD